MARSPGQVDPRDRGWEQGVRGICLHNRQTWATRLETATGGTTCRGGRYRRRKRLVCRSDFRNGRFFPKYIAKSPAGTQNTVGQHLAQLPACCALPSRALATPPAILFLSHLTIKCRHGHTSRGSAWNSRPQYVKATLRLKIKPPPSVGPN